jgi:acyl carrier protein
MKFVQRAEVRHLVREIAPREGDLDTTTRLVEDLGFDSVLLLELAVALEERFDLPTLGNVGRRGIRTVGDVEDLVAQLLASGAAE